MKKLLFIASILFFSCNVKKVEIPRLTDKQFAEYTIQNDKFTCILKCGNSKVILPINFSLAISEIMKHSRITVENIPIEGSKYQLQIAKRLINEGLFKIEN